MHFCFKAIWLNPFTFTNMKCQDPNEKILFSKIFPEAQKKKKRAKLTFSEAE